MILTDGLTPQSRGWAAQVADDLARARGVLARTAAPTRIGLVAARLVDTAHAHEAAALVTSLGPERAHEDAGLALARARLAELAGAEDEAGAWLVRAQALVDPTDDALAGRIAFRLGLSRVRRGELASAQTVADWALGVVRARHAPSADLLHLQALVADANGERGIAERLYRRAIARSASALTPMSRVIALHDLSETLSHRAPRESIELYGLALALLDAHDLDRGVRAAVANGMGYALLCAGDVASARARLHAAAADAAAVGRARVALSARFNGAIAEELGGACDSAASELRAVMTEAAGVAPDLATWARLRVVWLDLKRGSSIRDALEPATIGELREPYADTIRTLQALALAAEHSRAAIDPLAALASRYRARGDELTAFVLTLWIGVTQHVTGMSAAARRTVSDACARGVACGFTLSPNWWSTQLVDTARAVASAEHAPYVATWWQPATMQPPAHTVVIQGELITVDGVPLASGAWRRGKTGSRVLRRYFAALAAAHPAGLERDELADLLWPESDGDKAVRNLYWATRDLRDALADVEGLTVVVHEHRYRLHADANVLFR